MAEAIGHWLATLPDWLFLPALIIVTIVATAGWWLYYSVGSGIGFPEGKIDLRRGKRRGKK